MVNRIDLPNHVLDDSDKPEIEDCDRRANKCLEFDRSGLRQLAKEASKSESDLAQLEALIEGRTYEKQKHRIMKVDPIKLYPMVAMKGKIDDLVKQSIVAKQENEEILWSTKSLLVPKNPRVTPQTVDDWRYCTSFAKKPWIACLTVYRVSNGILITS
ncbi:hypothetical protein SARC_04164 [Sphaeroforma arctica JP610]|uniref:Uncharacterized protein n=1 Tax=Sphaeroforma arctica JP610 TaxID=667725 RepID=A0A0L0G3F7_9EUKA|nr:hypothetical protein SARC_04164 [Sphaeroforma arctica JP610]KNC83580.1 hypothetical protein SARC_04164 [Sphaeroforma arctica JP610]|eukprot:XP_014157482.1 hypothetical protein SARC_04164 [Sphaeroforma arctica JP610]